MENLRKRTGTMDTSITKRIQEIEQRISDMQYTIEEMDALTKKMAKCKKFLTQNIHKICNSIKR
jgi:TolA-binding protein